MGRGKPNPKRKSSLGRLLTTSSSGLVVQWLVEVWDGLPFLQKEPFGGSPKQESKPGDLNRTVQTDFRVKKVTNF